MLALRLVLETATTVTLGWDPVPGAVGYRFTSEKQAKPSHTWDPSRSSVRFAKGSAWYRVEPLLAPDRGEWPPATTPPLFDGRASLVTSMRGCSRDMTFRGEMTPRIYSGDINTYYEDDISLLPDGRLFRVGLNQDSRNPFWVGQPATKPSAEITDRRPIAVGQIDWYALSTRFLPGWRAGAWGVVAQFGYPTLTSPPLAIAISLKAGVTRIGIDRHAGIVTSGTTGLTNVEARFHDLADVAGKTIDWLIGVRWDPQPHGWVRVETRVEGGAWALRYEAHDTPTWQQQSGQAPKTSAADKIGAYQDASGLTAPWENVIHHSGITRWADEASARGSLG